VATAAGSGVLAELPPLPAPPVGSAALPLGSVLVLVPVLLLLLLFELSPFEGSV
jgi:hypothetical protein